MTKNVLKFTKEDLTEIKKQIDFWDSNFKLSKIYYICPKMIVLCA